MRINAESLGQSRHEETDLARLRRELCAERDELLTALKEQRDKLRDVTARAEDRDARQLILALEIVITIAEREDFAQMRTDRIAVVLRQLENRLRRLAGLMHGSHQRASCHVAALQCALADLRPRQN